MAIHNGDQRAQATEADDVQPSPWTRPGFILSTVLVLAIVVAGIVLSVTHGGSGSAPKVASPRNTPTPAQGSHATASGSDSICGLPSGSQELPVGPPATTWSLVGTMAAPSSTVYGPGVVLAASVRTCYARSPYGALFAAANFGAELEATSDSASAASALIKAAVLPGAGQQSALADVASAAGTPSDVRAQWAGYRFVDFTADRATVELVIRSTSDTNAGALVSVDYTLAWSSGDWKIVYTPESASQPGNSVTSLAGYVAWSGA